MKLVICNMDPREKNESLQIITKEFGIDVDHSLEYEQVVRHVNELLNHNFDKLIQILYRMDVYESKLRGMLAAKPADDAATLITDLMIERQVQKIKSRRENTRRDQHIDEEDKW